MTTPGAPLRIPGSPAGTALLSMADFRRLAACIQDTLGIRMPDVKRPMLQSRLFQRLRALGIDDFHVYVGKVLAGDGIELQHLTDAVTTNKTEFFREPGHFEFLAKRVLPAITHASRGNGFCSFWSAGCSTGEEAYSVAMTLADIKEANPGFGYRILASDVSMRALDKAIQAVYPASRAEGIPSDFLRRYMLRSRNPEWALIRVKPELRNRVRFLRVNLMHDVYPFEGLFDVVFCRNVIIYFDRTVQRQVLGRICDYLKPGGCLFLGHSETLTGMGLPLRGLAPTMYERL